MFINQKHNLFEILRNTFKSLLLFIFSLALLVTVPHAPVLAASGTCALKSITDFGETQIDMVADEMASASATVEYSCSSPQKYDTIRFCSYIEPLQTDLSKKYSGRFYQTRPDNARLAWKMWLKDNETRALTDWREAGATAGWVHYVSSWSPSAPATVASRQLMLNYLNRQQQDHVRAGHYNTSYQLVTRYKFGQELNGDCDNGMADADGTIISHFNVSASVLKSCQLENFLDIDFGKQDAMTLGLSNEAIRAYGNIGIRCTEQTPYTISINKGLNVRQDEAHMKSNNDLLPYRLLQPGCKLVWDDKSTLSGTGNMVSMIDNYQVCAELINKQGQMPAAGSYADTVIVNVTF